MADTSTLTIYQPILMTHTMPLQMKRRGVEMRLVLQTASQRPIHVDPVLVKTNARARTWWDDLLTGKVTHLSDIAKRAGVSKSYVGDVIKLAFLAPDITGTDTVGRDGTLKRISHTSLRAIEKQIYLRNACCAINKP